MDPVEVKRCIATDRSMCYGNTNFLNSEGNEVTSHLTKDYGLGDEFVGQNKVFEDLNNALALCGYIAGDYPIAHNSCLMGLTDGPVNCSEIWFLSQANTNYYIT